MFAFRHMSDSQLFRGVKTEVLLVFWPAGFHSSIPCQLESLVAKHLGLEDVPEEQATQ